mgnify:FL=1
MVKVKKIIYDEKYFGKLSYGVLNRLISTLATEEKIKEITSNNKILTKSYYMKKWNFKISFFCFIYLY